MRIMCVCVCVYVYVCVCVCRMEPGSQWERVYEKPTGTEFKNAELLESLRGGKYTYNEDELNIIKQKSPDLNYNVFIKVEKWGEKY